jgi:hypothetical protein
LGVFLENFKINENFWATFFHGTCYEIFPDKICVRLHFRLLFTNKSGHADPTAFPVPTRNEFLRPKFAKTFVRALKVSYAHGSIKKRYLCSPPLFLQHWAVRVVKWGYPVRLTFTSLRFRRKLIQLQLERIIIFLKRKLIQLQLEWIIIFSNCQPYLISLKATKSQSSITHFYENG